MKLLLALFVAGFATVANSQYENNIVQETSDSVKVIEESVKHLTTECNQKNHLENQANDNILKPQRGKHMNSRPRDQYYKDYKGAGDQKIIEVDGEQKKHQQTQDQNSNKRMERGQRRQRRQRGQRRERRQRRQTQEGGQRQFSIEAAGEEALPKEGGKFDRRTKRHPDFENMRGTKGPYPGRQQNKRGQGEKERQERWRKFQEQRQERLKKYQEQRKQRIQKTQKQGHKAHQGKVQSANREQDHQNLGRLAEQQAQSSILIRGSPVKITP